MGVAHEVSEHFWKNTKEGEIGSSCKEDCTPENHSNSQPFFIRVQTGGNKCPNLVENDWKARQKTY